MAAFASANPKVITDAITDNGNGTYTVRFFRHDRIYGDAQSGLQAEYVTVDDSLPMLNGVPLYARTPKGELWPAILEKAYAAFSGGYGRIESGKLTGLASDANIALTGSAGSIRFLTLTSTDDTYHRFADALAKAQRSASARSPAFSSCQAREWPACLSGTSSPSFGSTKPTGNNGPRFATRMAKAARS